LLDHIYRSPLFTDRRKTLGVRWSSKNVFDENVAVE